MKAIVLAAGKGTRLQSEAMALPKALRKVDGKPLIRYVLDNLGFLRSEDIAVVVGFLKEKVIEEIGGNYHYTEQKPPFNGTAIATLCARGVWERLEEPVLVCYCDMPFLSRNSYETMFSAHIASGAGHTLLEAVVDPPPPFGRLIRDQDGALIDIVEDSAATPEQRKITEVNVGVQVLDGARMWGWLEKVDNNNPKREHYLTGVTRVLAAEHIPQTTVLLENFEETLGVNTMEDLALAESIVAGWKKK